MPDTERDPRTDPRPGDRVLILLTPTDARREWVSVVQADAECIWARCLERPRGDGSFIAVSLADWTNICEGAEFDPRPVTVHERGTESPVPQSEIDRLTAESERLRRRMADAVKLCDEAQVQADIEPFGPARFAGLINKLRALLTEGMAP